LMSASASMISMTSSCEISGSGRRQNIHEIVAVARLTRKMAERA
jgi:hypothetical protein